MILQVVWSLSTANNTMPFVARSMRELTERHACSLNSWARESPPVADHTRLTEKPLVDQDRAAFDCGDDYVNNYMRGERIIRDIKNRETAVFVFSEPADESKILAYYSLSNSSVKRGDFSRKEQTALSYPATAAVLIGYLGVDLTRKGERMGSYILKRALRRCATLSEQSGCAAVVLEVETGNAKAIAMYEEAAFKAFREDPAVKETADGRPDKKMLYITMSNVLGGLALDDEATAQ